MRDWRRWLVGLIIAAALVGIVLHVGQLENYFELARHARPAWLLLAIVLQASTYLSLALSWRAVLQEGEKRHFKLKPLLGIALTKLFADQALPTAGMGGNVLLVDRITSIGATRGTAVAVLLVSIRGYYAAYLAFALASLMLLWVHGQASTLMVGLVTTFVLVALAIPALALWLRSRGSRPLPHLIERVRPIRQLLDTIGEAPSSIVADRRLLLRVGLLNGLVFSADILTLWACMLALGIEASPATALIAFTLSSIIVTLGPIPFGLGSFEATCTSVLHLLGVPIEAAISATMLLRFLILWLPLLPGMFLSRKAF